MNFVREEAERMMGMTCEEYMAFKQSNTEDEVAEYLESLLYRTCTMIVHGKMEPGYNGEAQSSYIVAKVYPQDYKSENQELLSRLHAYSAL